MEEAFLNWVYFPMFLIVEIGKVSSMLYLGVLPCLGLLYLLLLPFFFLAGFPSLQ